MSFNWKSLQNQSDIRGVALDGVPGETVNLTVPVTEKIGYAFASWLATRLNKPTSSLKIAIGHDSRLSADTLKNALKSGLDSHDCMILDFGLASTPAMFMCTVMEDFAYDGAIMITASHLPFNRNGFKFFTSKGGLEKLDISDILAIAAQLDELESLPEDHKPKHAQVAFMTVYAKMLVDMIRDTVNHPEDFKHPLKGFRIIVDAGNGAGGFFADHVLKPLGADTSGSLFLNPDGHFPNHIPNPELKEAMEAIQLAVVDHKADLGIIFDTDVDRAALVDRYGSPVNRNKLVALMSAIVLDEHPGSTIVTDSITSDGLTWFIEQKLKGKHHRFKRGYKNVINEAVRLNKEGEESWLAIETSGHAALKENYFLDDGAYLIAKVLVYAAKMKMNGGKDVLSLVDDLPQPAEDMEFRLKIQQTDFKMLAEQVLKDLETYAITRAGWKVAPVNHEGVRVACDSSCGDGWFLLRMSLHDPVLPLNIESNSTGGVKAIASSLLPFLDKYSSLDFSSVSQYTGN